MRCKTFQEAFNFRQFCLCKAPLSIYSNSVNVDNFDFSLKSLSDFIVIKNDEIVLPFCLKDYKNKYNILFNFIINVNSNKFTIKYNDIFMRLQYEKIIKKYFSIQNQFILSFNLKLKCSTGECDYNNHTATIYFNLSNYTIFPFNVIKEKFSITDGSNRYFFTSNFNYNSTNINFAIPDNTFVVGVQKNIELNSDQFLKYTFEKEFLLNKIKILLVFS